MFVHFDMEKPDGVNSVYILGTRVDILSKDDALGYIKESLDRKESSKYIVTPYSEFFLTSLENSDFQDSLNNSFLSLADGIFVVWASYFKELNKGKESKLSIYWNFIRSGASIIFSPSKIYSVIPERISGSNFAYDLAKLCRDNRYKLAILGGFDFGKGNTGILAGKRLQELYPGLEIVEIYPGERKEEYGDVVIDILKKSDADLLFCCYGQVKQEIWLRDNLSKTGISVGIGLGGTLDYISGVKKTPPEFLRRLGLEWFFRPFYAEGLNPKRFWKRLTRAWPAMFKSSIAVLREELKKI